MTMYVIMLQYLFPFYVIRELPEGIILRKVTNEFFFHVLTLVCFILTLAITPELHFYLNLQRLPQKCMPGTLGTLAVPTVAKQLSFIYSSQHLHGNNQTSE